MNWFRKGVLALLAALGLLGVPTARVHGQALKGRLCGQDCWYRVYYRLCPDKPWCYYGVYNDSCKAQQVVRYLQFEGCEAYFKSAA
jgi:hypothetical protein